MKNFERTICHKRSLWYWSGLILLLLTAIIVVIASYTRQAIKNAKLIENALKNPQQVKAGDLLRATSKSFQKLSPQQQQMILSDNKKLNKLVAESIYKNMDKSFKLLFKLPRPIRAKIIADSAANLRAKSNRTYKIDKFMSSPGGKAALQGAAAYFWYGLSGKQKAEVAPLIEAVNEIIKQNKQRR